jgi:hypothetical protein
MPIALILSSIEQHAAFHRDHDGIDEIIGVELLLDDLKVFPNRALANCLCFRNLLGDLSHGATLKNGGFALRQKRAWVGTLARLNQEWNNSFELLEMCPAGLG